MLNVILPKNCFIFVEENKSMLNLIATPGKLIEECTEIQAFLDCVMSEEISEALFRGNQTATYKSRTGKMMADAKYHLDSKMNNEIMETLKKIAKDTPFATSKTVNLLVDSLCRDEHYLYKWVERLNSTCAYQLDWCRTVVSNAKADRYASRGVNGQ